MEVNHRAMLGELEIRFDVVTHCIGRDKREVLQPIQFGTPSLIGQPSCKEIWEAGLNAMRARAPFECLAHPPPPKALC